jgi:hypothetical protein
MLAQSGKKTSFQKPAGGTEPKLDAVGVAAAIALGMGTECHPWEDPSHNSGARPADRHSPIRGSRDLNRHAYHPATDPFFKIEVVALGAIEPGEGNVVRMPIEISMFEGLKERDDPLGRNIQY